MTEKMESHEQFIKSKKCAYDLLLLIHIKNILVCLLFKLQCFAVTTCKTCIGLKKTAFTKII